MCLAALVHAGASLSKVERELKKIPVRFSISRANVRRAGVAAIKISVAEKGKNPDLSRWRDVRGLVESSGLDDDIKARGLSVVKSLFIAEAVAHGELYDRIHLHELSYIDTIVDIFGSIIALRELGVEKIYSSAVNVGSGTISSEHGEYPVPGPATSELLRSVPIYSKGEHELTTPTGAAILKGLSSGFGEMPLMTVEKVGVGAGGRDVKNAPNVLRVFVGKAKKSQGEADLGRRTSWTPGDIIVVETNIDDMNPQIYDSVIDGLFKEGALDVFLTPIIMKKGRPAIKLSVLCGHDARARLIDLIFRETTTLGVRFFEAGRITLRREFDTVETEYGNVRIKKAQNKSAPEYDDCLKAAKEHDVPVIEVMRSARSRAKNPVAKKPEK